MTIEEIKEIVANYDDNIVIFENPSYETAIIGVDSDGSRLIYDYDKMAEYLMEHDSMELGEAYEFIDFNTIRALPYMGNHAPIIKMNIV